MNTRTTKVLLICAVGLAATAAASEFLWLAVPVLVGGWLASKGLLRIVAKSPVAAAVATPIETLSGSKDLQQAWAAVVLGAKRKGTLVGETWKRIPLPERALAMNPQSRDSGEGIFPAFDESAPKFNPASGLPMSGHFDIGGNPYGMSGRSHKSTP